VLFISYNSLKKWVCVAGCALILAGSVLFANAETETYVVDGAHSSVEFRVKHFFSKVSGRFKTFEGAIVADREALEKSEIKATVDTGSVDTNQADRDKHLRAGDFFDAEKHPKMTFQSKSWKRVKDNEYEVTGDFTLRGVTKPVVLSLKSLGFGPGMKGAQLSGWEARTTIKRSDFGMTSGTPAVGDEVEIEINIEAKKQ